MNLHQNMRQVVCAGFLAMCERYKKHTSWIMCNYLK